MRMPTSLVALSLLITSCGGSAPQADTTSTDTAVTTGVPASTTVATAPADPEEPEDLWIEVLDLTSKVDMGGEASFLVASGGGSGQVSVDVSQVFTRGPLASSAPTDSYLANFVLDLNEDDGPAGVAVSTDVPMPGHYGLWVTATDGAGDAVEEYVEVSVTPTTQGILDPKFPLIGVWIEHQIWHLSPDEIAAVEEVLGHDLTIVHEPFTGFCTSTCNESGLLTEALGWIIEANKVPMMSFEFSEWDWEQVRPSDIQPTLQDVVEGQFDDYLSQLASNLSNLGGPLILQIGWEFNIAPAGQLGRGPRAFGAGADQYWNETADLTSHYGDDSVADGPERFSDVWSHVAELFKVRGADNVILVWSPNWISHPKEEWNTLDAYWPGDLHVDAIGPSIYNYAFEDRTFSSVWAEELEEFVQAHPDVPIIIRELGSAPEGNDPLWHSHALQEIAANYPSVSGVVLFSEDNDTGLYAFHNDPEKTDAIREVLDQGYYGYSE